MCYRQFGGTQSVINGNTFFLSKGCGCIVFPFQECHFRAITSFIRHDFSVRKTKKKRLGSSMGSTPAFVFTGVFIHGTKEESIVGRRSIN